MSGESDLIIARHEQGDRVLSGGTDAGQLAETMERHAPEPAPEAKGTAAVPAADGKPAEAAPAPVAKPTRGQQRFSELAAARDAEKARADAAEARAVAAEALAKQPPAREPEAKPAAAATPLPASAAVEKFAFPAYQDYVEKHPDVSYDEWEILRLDAYSDWRDSRSNIDGRISKTIAARDAQRELQATADRTHEKGRAAYADFDTVLASGPGAGVDLHTDETKASQRVAFIWRHPQSEHLQYAIMKDADLAHRLAGMDDIGFGMEIARMSTPAAPAHRAEWKPPAAPFVPVNGNSPTVGTSARELAGKGHDFDASGYREKRAAERKRAGR